MGWFDEQVRLRKQNDDEVFGDSFVKIAGAVMGSRISEALENDRTVTKNAIDEILKYYHIKSRKVPDDVSDMNDQLEYLMHPHGIMRRTVKLSGGWYKDAIGPMLGRLREDGSVVALIPAGLSGYVYIDSKTKEQKKINRKNEGLFDE